MIIWVVKIFFVPFLSFIVPIFAWNVPLVSLIFLKRSLVFPILLLSSISLHWSLRKAFFSLFAVLWNSAFKWVYLSYSPFHFVSFLFSAFVRPPQATILPFWISFSWRWSWSLPAIQCHKPWSIVPQAFSLSDLIPWIYLSLSLYNHKIWFRSYLNGLVTLPTFFNFSLNLAISSLWCEPQSAPGLVFADCIELLHPWLQRI